MHIVLIKKLVGFSYYGNIPEIPNTEDDRFEVFPLTFDDRDLIMPFVFEINKACGTALDFGDVEFFDNEQCRLLEGFIDTISFSRLNPRQSLLIEVIKSFSKEAQALKTGIVIEL
ncbi:MAG: hypothetical protein PUC01_10360 [Spirochaetales bacterium]|nr:hypothetical protein [Spirochaetales bacterium]